MPIYTRSEADLVSHYQSIYTPALTQLYYTSPTATVNSRNNKETMHLNFSENLTNLISARWRESETNETNLVGCQRCLQMPWAGAALELQMWTSQAREENMQKEMKTPTYGLGLGRSD